MSRTLRCVVWIGFLAVALTACAGDSDDIGQTMMSDESGTTSPAFEMLDPQEVAREREDERFWTETYRYLAETFDEKLADTNSNDERLIITLESACHYTYFNAGTDKVPQLYGVVDNFLLDMFTNTWEDNWYISKSDPWPHSFGSAIQKFCPEQLVPPDYYSQHG